MAIKFSLVTLGIRKVLRTLYRLRSRETSRSALLAAGDAAKSFVELTFVDQQDPWGRPWRPLKRRKGQALLKNRGLSNSFSREVFDDEVEVGSNLIYAWTHQFGWKKRNIPARPFLPIRSRSGDRPSERAGRVDIPPAWRRTILESVRESINSQIRSS